MVRDLVSKHWTGYSKCSPSTETKRWSFVIVVAGSGRDGVPIDVTRHARYVVDVNFTLASVTENAFTGFFRVRLLRFTAYLRKEIDLNVDHIDGTCGYN